jgi:hypothetical protein
MLRHIMSVSLAMTACATFIPTKVNAATLTVTPIDTLQKKPGESITFIFSLNSTQFEVADSFKLTFFNYSYDKNELSLDPSRTSQISPNTIISNTTIVARVTFNVLQPVKDGEGDLFGSGFYQDINNDIRNISTEEVLDVEPVPEQGVPEPLTIFGAATALGYGAILKRKSSKKTIS